ncbi:MAG: hypothetical protein L6V35_09560 [Alistipes putredinis]|nr:MAG: hypothetical protein L6V35_09560 [Alistipes putredinis]
MDWLGFGSGHRSLSGGMSAALRAYAGYEGGTNPRLDVLGNGLNNDWTLRTKHPASDLKLNMSYNHTWKRDGGQTYGLLADLNYSNTYKTQLDMEKLALRSLRHVQRQAGASAKSHRQPVQQRYTDWSHAQSFFTSERQPTLF